MAEQAEAGTVSGDDIRDDQEQKKYQYPEVLFPRFTSETPWGAQANFYNPQQVRISISKLCHITHEAEAEGIKGETEFTFIPRQKLGKQLLWDGSPRGTTYKEDSPNRYQEIPRSPSNPVFPGYLSWWGINVEKDIRDKMDDEKPSNCYLPDYLVSPPKSQYGNKVFSITLEHILQDYQSRSRTDRQNEKVRLRGYGTLRYKREICYVIMVCMEGDNVQGTFALNDRQFDPEDVFQPDGMVNSNGVVEDYTATPTFQPQSIVTWCNGESYDWENLAFCFYFPSSELKLICTRPNIEEDDIDHDQSKCPAKRPECPNIKEDDIDHDQSKCPAKRPECPNIKEDDIDHDQSKCPAKRSKCPNILKLPKIY